MGIEGLQQSLAAMLKDGMNPECDECSIATAVAVAFEIGPMVGLDVSPIEQGLKNPMTTQEEWMNYLRKIQSSASGDGKAVIEQINGALCEVFTKKSSPLALACPLRGGD